MPREVHKWSGRIQIQDQIGTNRSSVNRFFPLVGPITPKLAVVMNECVIYVDHCHTIGNELDNNASEYQIMCTVKRLSNNCPSTPSYGLACSLQQTQWHDGTNTKHISSFITILANYFRNIMPTATDSTLFSPVKLICVWQSGRANWQS